MSKPKAGIYHAVDESGDSYRRMEKAGAKLAWEPAWITGSNKVNSDELTDPVMTACG